MNRTSGRDIAVVGMAGRFPGARDVDEFWANLRVGVESVARFSDDRLAAHGVARAEAEDPDHVRVGTVFDGVELFDAEFFGYTAREALVMDPQHRLFLETAWEALEHAGHDPARHDGRIGVFAGAGTNTYLRNVHSNPDVVAAVGDTQVLLGNELGFLATRVSYKLGLRGPSLSLRTACSSSLVALHLASRSLRDGESDLALAGGVFVYGDQHRGHRYQDGGFLSPDGHCRPFDAGARGTVFGTGVGVLVLRRLEEALAAGDTVHAVVKGSAVNNDGALKVGFTAPAVDGQAAVISAALADAGVPAGSIGYLEAHGTGTVLGDPVEVRALTRAFRESTDDRGFCAIGSVKGNIGHLDAASGVAGVVKAVQALRHAVLPATLNFERPNPAIDFASSPFRVQTAAAPWPAGAAPRRAGVSAFGFGGTNAHVVLEEAPAAEPGTPSPRDTQLVVLSARTPEALEAATDRLVAFLRERPPALADVAFTSAVGRQAHAHRRVVVGSDAGSVAAALESRDPASALTRTATREAPPVAFLFSGQGAQHAGMARELHEREPVFRAEVDRCAEVLLPLLGHDIRERLFAQPGSDLAAELDRTEVAQPALFVVEHALVRLWRSWGVEPSALLGHSLGEYVAACVAGVFTVEDALRLVALRGRLMGRARPGSMVGVVAEREAVVPLLEDGLSLAAHNSRTDCVVSGDDSLVAGFTERAAARGLVVRPLRTSHAFHSALMEPVVEEFVAAVAATPRSAPRIPFVSNVTGTWITPHQAVDPDYWGRHVLATVEFAAGVATCAADPDVVLLEVGPGRTLSGFTRRAALGGDARTVVASLPHRDEARGDVRAVQEALGRLWLAGAVPDWAGYYAGERRLRVPLPTYPFQRRRYWLDVAERSASAPPKGRRPDLADWFHVPTWERSTLPAAAAVHEHRWLVFRDRSGLADRLVRHLRAAGAAVTTVTAGGAWSARGDDYELDVRDGTHHERLVDELRAGAGLPDRVVHCWNVTSGDDVDVDTATALAFDSPVRLATALGRHADGTRRHLWVLSDGLHDVVGDERLTPLKATLLGPCRVIPREHPELACRSVDVALAGSPADRAVGMLLAEFAVEPGPEAVAHRGAHRWVQKLVPLPLADPAGPVPVRPGGVHLVTGGLGGIGLALAGQLASSGARLVLTSRRRLPPEEDWPRLEAAGDEVVTAVAALRRSGAEVVVESADVADAGRMREVVDRAVARWGALDGVFHAAGVAGGGLLQLKSAESAAEVLRPKVRGTLALDEALAGREPEVMVLFGSNAANTGDVGLVDYCAGNAFLDAFAHARSRRARTLVVDWGPWREVGMAAGADLPAEVREMRARDLAERGMTPAQGLEALARVLVSGAGPQVVVSPVDPAVLRADALVLDDRVGGADAIARLAPAETVHARADLPTDYVPPSTDLERALCEVWQDALGVDRVGVHDSFFELGGNSLIAIPLIREVNARAGLRLSVVNLFEATTVSRLAALAGAEPAAGVAESNLRAERASNAEKRKRYLGQRRALRTRSGR